MPERIEKKQGEGEDKPTPILLSINICDSIIRDEITKKVSLIGLFNTITATSFPCIHPNMHVHIVLTNGHGKYDTDVRFINLRDNKPLVGMKGELEFKDPLQVLELNICWHNLKFNEPGAYAIEVLCDSKQVGQRKFMVISPNQNVLPTSGTNLR